MTDNEIVHTSEPPSELCPKGHPFVNNEIICTQDCFEPTTERGGEMSETTVMANSLETDTLDAILKRLWQNGYGINRYEDLRKEIIKEVCEKFVLLHSIGYATLREQIARGIEAKCISAEHQGNHNGMGALTSDPSIVYYPETFSVCGRCSVAAAIARGK